MYCDNPPTIGLFDLGKYGVPVAAVGMGYIVCFSTLLLPHKTDEVEEVDDELFVRARILKWSPTAGRTVRESGMRGLPGMFLVSVKEANTGETLRAVGPDIVLKEGDLLYFSGKFESFGRVCQEYGLEAVTNENDSPGPQEGEATGAGPMELVLESVQEEGVDNDTQQQGHNETATFGPLPISDIEFEGLSLGEEVEKIDPLYGASKEGFMRSSRDTRIRAIYRLREMTENSKEGAGSRGGSQPQSPSRSGNRSRSASLGNEGDSGKEGQRRQTSGDRGQGGGVSGMALLNSLAPATVIVAPDPTTSKKNVILIGINAPDRPGLLHDISKGLARLSLQALRTEASVVGLRSVSIWRCEVGGALRRERRVRYGVDEGDVEEIWSVLNALLETEGGGTEAIKQKGLRVIRTRVPGESSLIGKTAKEAKFRVCFRAAIVAVKRGGGVLGGTLRDARFEKNDVLLLQVGDDSPLLTREYQEAMEEFLKEGGGKMSRSNSRDMLLGGISSANKSSIVKRFSLSR